MLITTISYLQKNLTDTHITPEYFLDINKVLIKPLNCTFPFFLYILTPFIHLQHSCIQNGFSSLYILDGNNCGYWFKASINYISISRHSVNLTSFIVWSFKTAAGWNTAAKSYNNCLMNENCFICTTSKNYYDPKQMCFNSRFVTSIQQPH